MALKEVVADKNTFPFERGKVIPEILVERYKREQFEKQKKIKLERCGNLHPVICFVVRNYINIPSALLVVVIIALIFIEKIRVSGFLLFSCAAGLLFLLASLINFSFESSIPRWRRSPFGDFMAEYDRPEMINNLVLNIMEIGEAHWDLHVDYNSSLPVRFLILVDKRTGSEVYIDHWIKV